jgi:hypothetical protein
MVLAWIFCMVKQDVIFVFIRQLFVCYIGALGGRLLMRPHVNKGVE